MIFCDDWKQKILFFRLNFHWLFYDKEFKSYGHIKKFWNIQNCSLRIIEIHTIFCDDWKQKTLLFRFNFHWLFYDKEFKSYNHIKKMKFWKIFRIVIFLRTIEIYTIFYDDWKQKTLLFRLNFHWLFYNKEFKSYSHIKKRKFWNIQNCYISEDNRNTYDFYGNWK